MAHAQNVAANLRDIQSDSWLRSHATQKKNEPERDEMWLLGMALSAQETGLDFSNLGIVLSRKGEMITQGRVESLSEPMSVTSADESASASAVSVHHRSGKSWFSAFFKRASAQK
eukprot:CAMPEP_0185830866 /NCGR_PEP_ID=MMETSP1353-20130828/1132_1 /TAXON_ID=1077150 /ORGANISM="Erythrolobus australicus, Strain CCMP3124" /LENGTH=114 /DNA_ID=CAMNT_0028528855 /DNA_START=245 /DNA_END=589 /DNA_ORIENTATION=-